MALPAALRVSGWVVGLLAMVWPSVVGAQPTASLLAAENAASDLSRTMGFAHAISSVAGDGATLVYPGAEILTGRAAITAFLVNQPALESLVIQWSPLHVEVARDGGFGVSWGALSLVSRTGSEAGVVSGRYLAAWKRDGETWRLMAFAPLVTIPGVPVLPTGAASRATASGVFAQADRDFAAMAGRDGAPVAFETFAALDAVTFSGSGVLNRGPAAIRASLEAGSLRSAHWEWAPFVAESATSGDLGFTVGRATIQIESPDGPRVSHSKYLSLWRLENGRGRFLADGGSDRPAGPVQP